MKKVLALVAITLALITGSVAAVVVTSQQAFACDDHRGS